MTSVEPLKWHSYGQNPTARTLEDLSSGVSLQLNIYILRNSGLYALILLEGNATLASLFFHTTGHTTGNMGNYITCRTSRLKICCKS